MGCCCAEDEDPERPEETDGLRKSDLSNPIENRGCTDIPCLLVFFLFWIGMIIIAGFSVWNGDALRMLYGYDSFGNTCDKKNSPIENITFSGEDMTGREYVFFMDVRFPQDSLSICVTKCPDTALNSIEDVQNFSRTTGSKLCRYDIDIANYTNVKQDEKGPCPVTKVYKSFPVLYRCIPSSLTEIPAQFAGNIVRFLNLEDAFTKVLADLVNSWKECLILCFIAVGFASLMVILIRFLATIIVYVIVALAVLGSIVGTAFLWWTYASMKNKLDTDVSTKIPLLQVEIDSEQAFLIYAIVATVLTVILLVVLLVMRKRIALVVALFHEAGKCIGTIPCLLLQPIWTFLVLVVYFAFWVIIMAYLSTSEKPTMDVNGFVKYQEHYLVTYFWWYHLFGLIWISEFIVACQELVISGAVATWYFSREKSQLGWVISKSMKRLTFYHLGSVSFGALIITLVKFPRMVLMYMQKQMKGSQNKCAQFCLKCCICCLWCLEKCLKFLNRNAYTVIAIKGTNFCSSARRAFLTLISNALRVAAINSVGDFVLFLGKIGVMAATTAVGVVWLKSRADLHYFAIPVLLVSIFAFFIAHCFLSTYEMVIDAMLLCFCEDCDINDGSPERPYYMSTSLMEFVSNSSEALNKLKAKPDGEDGETARL